ncbi:hypothetical protein AAJ72_14545 [Citromicrobium sp. RCC1885]|uniref:hypothetical protein n=1 Tax=unclassified Citromicrobium TaxID=2630544 RepID=UPI0006C8EE2B|nr:MULTISPECIES: hypothetical protein [unclassified Citromicrobium]KPM21563.1 hypothetical protein AAJ72_14545 [Citromicrobium sp. RCC1885]KPM23512.1 hypothetical protein AAJ74_15615 [Citromicrobium sp. RCC1878]OAM06954.1 hypothetical protein A0U43_13640 [Citromicrobium sp. RCC1897]|tara:strand:+ start:14452 stop:14784 length:333 start_codon:yes stop_codon:yes gene_type:complete
MTLLERIENHLRDNDISATTFGREAVGDPRFVLDLRKGRNPRRKTVMRLEAYLSERGANACACQCGSDRITNERASEQFKYPAKSAMIEKLETGAPERRGHSGSGEGDNR